MNVLSEFLNCTELYGNYYITNNLLEKCNDNSRYEYWKYSLIVPSFIVFGFVVPFSAFYYMLNKRDQLFDDKYIYKIGFLLHGYNSKKFYW